MGKPYTTVAFLLGAITSVISGYIGMQIAVRANVRTAKLAETSLNASFDIAFRGGMVLGFVLVGLALLVLHLLIVSYESILADELMKDGKRNMEAYQKMFEAIAGYGLGGSTVALFGRVGGGIYTKAADVGADLVGKVVEDLDEDSLQNPGVIADNVGDNVGDIAGMGSDLFGSFAESTCAALIISASSDEIILTQSFYYPLMISATGIIVGLVTSFIATHITTIERIEQIEATLKTQLFVSTLLMTPTLYFVAMFCLPAEFHFKKVAEGGDVTSMSAFICTVLGLWSGLFIGMVTEYFTSASHSPVEKIAHASVTGAAPNIILGLALGYRSTMIPVLFIALSIFVSFALANMYGIALAALGMLSTLTLALTIDGFGPIADNAGGIVEMTSAGPQARTRTDALDAAGNTTAAVGKGFAIGSACLVALALFGAFVTRADMEIVNILRPLEFSGLIIGAMLPYYFTAMTMEAVGDAASLMVSEIKRQFDSNPGIKAGTVEPDYESCIAISTAASIDRMIAPGVLVLGSPLLMGFLFGPRGVAGMLAGAICSGVQIAISASNSGGAWDNAKKFIEAGKLIKDGEVQGKRSEPHKAAVIGDTVGDPLKDTSGPSINILIKLMAITSLVFGGAFVQYGSLVQSISPV
jgi:H+-translocating diphosphatase